MKKIGRYWWVLLIIVVSVVGGVGYYYYAWDYPIYSDVSKPQEFPTVSWRAVVAGGVARSLARQIEPLPESVIPITSYSVSGDGYWEEMGVRMIAPSNEAIKDGIYRDTAKHPYRWVAGYQTMIGEERYYILYTQWQNAEGSVSYIPFIYPENEVIWDGSVDPQYLEVVGDQTAYYPASVMAYYRVEICTASMGGMSGYCNWLFEENNLSKYKRVLDEWQNNQSVPSEMGRLPVMSIRQQWVVGGEER